MRQSLLGVSGVGIGRDVPYLRQALDRGAVDGVEHQFVGSPRLAPKLRTEADEHDLFGVPA